MYRNLLGLTLSLVSLFLIARAIGPKEYGQYFVAGVTLDFISCLCQLGLGPVVQRKNGEQFEKFWRQYFTLSFSTAILISVLLVLTVGSLPLLTGQIKNILCIMSLGLPALVGLTSIRVASEKKLRLNELVVAELLGQIVFILVSVSLISWGWGATAPASAWLLQVNLIFWILFFRKKKMLDLKWDLSELGRMVRLGTSQLVITLLLEARVPLMVSVAAPSFGLGITGELGIIRRLVQKLNLFNSSNGRLTMMVCSTYTNNRRRLKIFIAKNLWGNIIGFGLLGCLVVTIPDKIVYLLMGPEWVSVKKVIPYFISSFLLLSACSVLDVALQATDAVRLRMGSALVYLLTLLMGSIFFVSAYGFVGWGYAELLSSAVYMAGLLMMVRTKVGRIPISSALLMLTAFVGSIATRNFWGMIPLTLMLCLSARAALRRVGAFVNPY